jgi:hypothetical protein
LALFDAHSSPYRPWFALGVFGCTTSLLRSYFDVESLPQVIFLKSLCRFGNNLLQLETSLGFCERLGISNLYYEPGFLYLNESFEAGGSIQVRNSPVPAGVSFISSHFLFGFSWDPYFIRSWDGCIDMRRLPLTLTFRDRVLKYFSSSLSNATTLYIHNRGGDIFTSWGARAPYGQPPCQYYRDAIALDRPSHQSTHLVAEDNRNPCTVVLVGEGHRWAKKSLKIDLSTLLYAKRVVWSRGTFSWAIIRLSSSREVTYTYHHGQSSDPLIYDCLGYPNYTAILSDWTASPEQLRLMTSQPGCITWRKGFDPNTHENDENTLRDRNEK